MAFVSYTSRDGDSDSHNTKKVVGRLEEELRLRGFEVFVDTSSITDAARIETEIFPAIDRCDVFIALITPRYLERPYCISEFERAQRHSLSGTPRIYPLTIGLGDNRDAIQNETWDKLHFDFGAHWINDIFINFDQEHASDVARSALEHVFRPDTGPSDGEWRICLVSRNTPPSFDGLTLDASLIFGGSASEVGSQDDWRRMHEAVLDVEAVLRVHGPRRSVVFSPQCHLPAALMFGWIFRRNAGWTLVAMQCGSICAAESTIDETVLTTQFEPSSFDAGGGRLAVALDVKGRSIDRDVRRSYSEPPRGYLWAFSSKTGDLNPAEIGSAAVRAAQEIVGRRDEFKPGSLDFFMAAPASFAALVGHLLGAIHCSIALFECDKETGDYHALISLKEQ